VTTNLWPYAVTNVCNCLHDCPSKDNKKSRTELFTASEVRPNLNHHHHIGVPVYVLDRALQLGYKIPKWWPRAQVGIYLGKSPRHARNVGLVLNPMTGMVSPLFHLRYDDTFETIQGVQEITWNMENQVLLFKKTCTRQNNNERENTTEEDKGK
jgi:hypothetical protein